MSVIYNCSTVNKLMRKFEKKSRRSEMDYKDTNLSPKGRAEALLKELSLEEKIRQIGCSSVRELNNFDECDLKNGTGEVSVPMGEPRKLAEQIKEMQDYIMDNSPHRIPAIIHGEALAGPVSFLGGNQYPISIGLGATFEPELVEKMSEYTRKQMLAHGIRHALSPVADLAKDPRWGRCNETYGSDPTLSSEMTVAFVKGLQGEDIKDGVAATGKHFLGYSVTESGLNSHRTMVTDRELREQFAKPFEAAINVAGIKSIMNSYAQIDGRPVATNKAILTDLLRDDLGFDGLVVSDYGSAAQTINPHRLAETKGEAAKLCIEAGLDVECPNHEIYGEEMLEAVRSGEIPEELIDRSVLRVLTLKFEMGLFEDPYPRFELMDEAMDNAEANKGSLEAARKSITLLKNDGILPIKDKKVKVAVIGPTANSLRLIYSHYTAVANNEIMITMRTLMEKQVRDLAAAGKIDLTMIMNQGRDGAKETEKKPKSFDFSTIPPQSPVNMIASKYVFDDEIRKYYPDAQTILDGIKDRFENVEFLEGCDYKGFDESGIPAAVELAKNSDVVILCVGEKSGIEPTCSSGENFDTSSIGLPGVMEKLARAVVEANGNVVAVHTGAKPWCSEWAYENIPAIIEAWFPSTYGGRAIAEVITGEYNPAGRTPMDLPRTSGHIPVHHMQYNGSSSNDHVQMFMKGYTDSLSEALIPFGYGLSYTKFDYQNISLSDLGDSNIAIDVTIKNIGDVDGEEVVQLYGKDLYASVVRPRQELIGFKRVAVRCGETKTVRFTFNIDVLAFTDIDRKWIVEKGKFEFKAGRHAEDNALKVEYTLDKTQSVDPNKRCFYANAEVVG